MLHRFSEDHQILPERPFNEFLACCHSKKLSVDATWEDIEVLCKRGHSYPLAWGPKFINLIRRKAKDACKEMGLKLDWKGYSTATTPRWMPSH